MGQKMLVEEYHERAQGMLDAARIATTEEAKREYLLLAENFLSLAAEISGASHESSPTFEEIVWFTLDQSIALLGAKFGNLQLPVGDELLIVAQRGFQAPFLKAFAHVRSDDGCACGRAMRERKTIIIPDVNEDADFAPFRDFAHEAGFRAVQSTPLFAKGGAFMGVLSMHFGNVHQPASIDMQTLRRFSAIAAERLHQIEAPSLLAHRAEEMGSKLLKSVRI